MIGHDHGCSSPRLQGLNRSIRSRTLALCASGRATYVLETSCRLSAAAAVLKIAMHICRYPIESMGEARMRNSSGQDFPNGGSGDKLG